MKKAALLSGFLSSLLGIGALIAVGRPTLVLDRVVVLVACCFSAVTILMTLFSYFFPSGKDYAQLALERADREAHRIEKEEWLRVRKQEDELRRHEADTRKLQTEALMVQQRYEEDQRRLARNARARERRRQERGLPPEAPRTRAHVDMNKEVPEDPRQEPSLRTSALDAILLDDDDDSV